MEKQLKKSKPKKLFSFAHMAAARKLFPEKINLEWCNNQWTDEEINECKAYESKNFSKSPTKSSYQAISPKAGRLDELVSELDDVTIVENFLRNNPKISTFLSVGCGTGYKEIYLAKKFPHIKFTCIDNAPVTEQFNVVAAELELKNIKYHRHDLRNGKFGEFDVVFSMAVIYCIPDSGLSNFFTSLAECLSPEGHMIVGCDSSSNLVLKLFSFYFSWREKVALKSLSIKSTGWQRDINYVSKRVPKSLDIVRKFIVNHRSYRIPGLSFISKYILPLSNTGFIFIIKSVESK